MEVVKGVRVKAYAIAIATTVADDSDSVFLLLPSIAGFGNQLHMHFGQ